MNSSPRPDTEAHPRAGHHDGRGEAKPPCNWGLPTGKCGEPGRPFPVGARCPAHLPNHHLKTQKETATDGCQP